MKKEKRYTRLVIVVTNFIFYFKSYLKGNFQNSGFLRRKKWEKQTV